MNWETREVIFIFYETQAFQKAFSKSFVLAILRKSYMKYVFRNDHSVLLCSPKDSGYHEESCMLPSLSPSLHSVCTLILRVKRKGTGVKGTTGVSRDKWGLQ